MTPQQRTNKIAELEQWLEENSKEHEARPQIEARLKKLKSEQIGMAYQREIFDL